MKTRRIQHRQNKKNTKRKGKRKIRTGGGKRKVKKSKRKQNKPTEISFKNLQCSPDPDKKKDYTNWRFDFKNNRINRCYEGYRL